MALKRSTAPFFEMNNFLAIDLDMPCRAAIAALQGKLMAAGPPCPLRWVNPTDLHLTLHFFSALDADRIEALARELDPVLHRFAPFTLTLGTLGCFPGPHRPRVCWLGVEEPAERLRELHASVRATLHAQGIESEARRFAPHVTLARLPPRVKDAESRSFGDWFAKQPSPQPRTVEVAVLRFFRTHSAADGARYARLREVRLGSGAASG